MILDFNTAVSVPMSVPEQSGVYVIWNGDSAQYVGRSTNLRKRIRTHVATYGKDVAFTFEVIAHELSAPREHELIQQLQPPLNVRTPSPDGSRKAPANLTLRSDVRELLQRMCEADNRSSISNMIEQLTLDEAARRGWLDSHPKDSTP